MRPLDPAWSFDLGMTLWGMGSLPEHWPMYVKADEHFHDATVRAGWAWIEGDFRRHCMLHENEPITIEDISL